MKNHIFLNEKDMIAHCITLSLSNTEFHTDVYHVRTVMGDAHVNGKRSASP